MPKPSADDIGVLIQNSLSGETEKVVKQLTKGKLVNVDTCDAQGNHPLLAAACGGHLALVTRLVELNAPLEQKNSIGTSALWLAAGYGHVHVLDYLIEKGCDLNAPNSTKDTPSAHQGPTRDQSHHLPPRALLVAGPTAHYVSLVCCAKCSRRSPRGTRRASRGWCKPAHGT